MSDPREVLRKAADWLEANEWCQGVLMEWNESQGDPCGACALGAIQIVEMNHPDIAHKREEGPDFDAAVLLARHIYACPDGLEDPYTVPRWNDAEERTKDEVISALRKAAKS